MSHLSPRTRVLHVGKFYPPHMGGMETHLRDLACGQSHTMRVDVVVSNDSWRTEREVIDGVSVQRMGTLGVLASSPISPLLVTAIRQSEADLVHLHFPNPAAALALLASGYRGPVVVTHHSDILGRKHLRKLTDPFVAETMKQASAVIATSRRYALTSQELRPYLAKCWIVPLGVSAPAELPATSGPADEHRPHSERPSLLAVGRLVPYKGFEYLIRAMVGIDASLVIVGTGPLRASLQSMIETNRLTESVRLAGHVENLTGLYASADVVVMPSISRAEAFGLVQLEAMAHGKPVINTELDSGVPEVVLHGKTGLTIPPKDVRALSDAISLLLRDHQLRRKFGEAALLRFGSRFSVERMVARIAEVYGEALAAPASSVHTEVMDLGDAA